VVARYWVEKKGARGNGVTISSKFVTKRPPSISLQKSDDENFCVVPNAGPQRYSSWLTNHQARTWGAFVDAVCDKAYVVPVWIYLLSTVTSVDIEYMGKGFSPYRLLQYMTLWSLILTETWSACVRFRAFYTSTAIQAPKMINHNFSSSALKADHVGKAKQTFEMLGTALFVIPAFRFSGLILLMAAAPLAYESVRRKLVQRVIYVAGNSKASANDFADLKFWMQARSLGSHLIVGIRDENTDHVKNACAVPFVSEVIASAPSLVDLSFVEKEGIDYVVCLGPNTVAADEVVAAGRCICVDAATNTARIMKYKGKNED